MTRYRLTTLSSQCIVDAAHIHQFSRSRNDDPRNGLALSKNAHWMFDEGLWTLSEDYRVIAAKGHFEEEYVTGTKGLIDYEGSKILLPGSESNWPDPRYIRWHQKNRFKGAV